MFIKVSTGLCLPNICIKNKELLAEKPRMSGLGVNTKPLKKRVQTETTETAFKMKDFSLLKHTKNVIGAALLYISILVTLFLLKFQNIHRPT